ncbi:MAG TPA: LysM peptidoglycan-binding domain-containing protein, partial [Ilumatobacteraceae bacterium]|nr:LysM peptidoglycan-binding domain-containing protein [Ilumatobacteraceae bacterium]
MHPAGSRSALRLLASLLALAVVAVAPLGLTWVARQRFGRAAPWTDVDPPWQWDVAAIRDALTNRLTESVIVDVIVRVALAATWVAVAVILVTIVAETVHMVRHRGMALPTIRGLGWSQRVARFVAVGLIVVLPTTHAPRSPVHAMPTHATSARSALITPGRASTHVGAAPERTPASTNGGSYLVEPGDSVFQIAERLAGPDPGRTVAVADQILDLNLGRVMTDGQRFTNAAYIEPGWVLELPTGVTSPVTGVPAGSEPAAVHVVERGETLWSIARDELGAPTRWAEIWEHNRGDDMGDGEVLADPDLIMPGWELDLPMSGAPVVVAPATAPPVSDPDSPALPTTPPPVPAPPTTAPSTTSLATPPDVGAHADVVAADPVASVAPAPPLPPPTVPAPAASVPPMPDGFATETGPPPDSANGSATYGDVGDFGDVTAMIDGRRMFGLEHAAMLSAGVLTLVGVHRLRRLRSAGPRARVPVSTRRSLATERALRTIGADERLLRVDIAIRAAAAQLIDRDRYIVAVLVDEHGAVEIVLSGPSPADEPFSSTGDRWHLPATTAIESLGPAARPVGAPCVGLVQLGVTPDSRDLYVDLEALAILAVDASADRADAVVSAIAATLGTSVLAEVAQLVGVGLDPAAFVGHRHHSGVDSFDAALDLATSLLGSTALANESTFALRTRMAGGEAWEPAIVLVASDYASEVDDSLPAHGVPGLAVVVAGRVDGAHHTLVDEGSTWRLHPIGIDVIPLGLDDDDLTAITELVEQASAGLEMPDGLGDAPDGPGRSGTPIPSWSLLVRLLGPVDVVDEQGGSADFERSKTRELIAWLATHRGRSTRTLARTALWDLDVRDATFSNVVSEARRAMARLV